jgi:surfactin synthase thioesterase subunit
MKAFIDLYKSGYFDFAMFADTFAYNFGLMYDALVTSFESVLDDNFFMAGYSLGSIVYMTFFIA